MGLSVTEKIPNQSPPPGGRAEQPPAMGMGRLRVIAFSHAGQHGYTALLGITIPFVVADFHVTYALVGVLFAAAGITLGLFQGLATISRRFTTRSLLTAQNIGSTVAAVLAAVAPVFAIFAAARFVQSICGWPQHPVGSGDLVDNYPNRRGEVLGWHVTGGNVGTLAAPLLGTLLITWGGWRMAMWALALLLAVTAATVWVGLGRNRPSQAVHPPGLSPDGQPLSARGAIGRAVLRRPAMTLLIAGIVAGSGQGLGILSVYVPAYLRTGLHLSVLDVGLIATAMYVGGVAGPYLGGRLSDRRGRKAVLLLDYLLGAGALIGFVFAGSNPLVLGAVALAVGFLAYSELALRQAFFSELMPKDAQRASFGVFFTTSQAVGAIWIAVVGIVITDVSFRAAYIVMAAGFLLAAAIVAVGTTGWRAQRPGLTGA